MVVQDFSHIPNECLQEILKHIDENDTKTLYSSLLVNRLWCLNSVSILWKNPFKIQKKEKISYKILLTLLSYYYYNNKDNEGEEEGPIKKSLKELNIYNNKKMSTIFDYPYFIKKLDLTNMLQMIFYLNEDKDINLNNSSIYQIIWNTIIFNSNIETLIINTVDYPKFSKYFKLFFKIPETKKCFSKLKSLTLRLKSQDFLFLSGLIECINDQIKDLELELQSKSTHINSNFIINLINLQKNFESFRYKDNSGILLIYPIILKLKDHSHSIERLFLEQRCNIDVNLFSNFENFSNLQELSFRNFDFGGNHEIFTIIKFPKLKSLSFDWITSRTQQHLAYVSEPMIKFIQNHAVNLEHLSMKVVDVIMRDTFKMISICCSNLKSFSCFTTDQNDMIFIYSIFKNNPHLKSIDLCIMFPIRNSNLSVLAKEIPESINNIAIGYSTLGKVNISIFLRNLKCDKLKSFKFNWQSQKNVDITEMIKEISKDKGWTLKGCELGPAQYQLTYTITWE
ncbi:hypothetical protein RclHR1_00970014 [Rhizophagus clarus]|uniref:F-box domain-containing protein n=1 Tax=Rhizophagus clarus TaxID=94130 RepID=A0A2Z6SB54_9GLOM|nr:hypothetical protein RclHR1_00970014 [Rhizophagus clarus]GES96681.1 hypothetical protein GLOIN_2v1705857 [Rhizophagus clarus]